jgi:phage-related protein
MNGWTVGALDDSVEAELDEWPLPLRASLLRIIERIEAVGLPRVREPFVKHLEGKLWEMRASANRLEGRAVYVAVTGKRVVIVLAFEKKTQKTPRRFIDLALERMKRIEP